MIGKRIKQIRKEKNITQGKLGFLIGKPGSTICKIEKGKRRVFGDELKIIAGAFDMTISELLGDDNQAPTGTDG